jgi:hypothetical protein
MQLLEGRKKLALGSRARRPLPPAERGLPEEKLMRLIKSVMFAATLAFTGAVVAAPAFAGDPPKAEKKCDKAGKECKDGADCKPENCKK